MKTITILLITIALNSCGSTKTTASTEESAIKSETTMNISKTAQENIKVVYRSHTRGNFKQVILDKKTVSVQQGYNAKPDSTACNDKDWDALVALIERSNLKTMTTLEAPSKAHQYDGAPMVNFTITKGEAVYDFKPFDAGNPHKEAAELVNMVLNIAGLNKE